jgi:hypothetical protein
VSETRGRKLRLAARPSDQLLAPLCSISATSSVDRKHHLLRFYNQPSSIFLTWWCSVSDRRVVDRLLPFGIDEVSRDEGLGLNRAGRRRFQIFAACVARRIDFLPPPVDPSPWSQQPWLGVPPHFGATRGSVPVRASQLSIAGVHAVMMGCIFGGNQQ